MCDYPFFIPQVVLFANSSLFWFKVTNEHREFRNYLTVTKKAGDTTNIDINPLAASPIPLIIKQLRYLIV